MHLSWFLLIPSLSIRFPFFLESSLHILGYFHASPKGGRMFFAISFVIGHRCLVFLLEIGVSSDDMLVNCHLVALSTDGIWVNSDIHGLSVFPYQCGLICFFFPCLVLPFYTVRCRCRDVFAETLPLLSLSIVCRRLSLLPSCLFIFSYYHHQRDLFIWRS